MRETKPETVLKSAMHRAGVVAVATLLAVAGLFAATPAHAQSNLTIPAGTTLTLRVETEVDSRSARPGDEFRASVTEPVIIRGISAVPQNTIVKGRVLSVATAKSWGRPSGATVQIDEMVSPTGETVRVIGDLADARGTAFITVDNIPVGAEITLRLTRPVAVSNDFFRGDEVLNDRETVLQAQTVLRDLGYYNGRLDGRLSPVTRAAIERFQRDERLSTSGLLNKETLERLGLISESGSEVTTVNVVAADARLRGDDQLNLRIRTTGANNLQLFEDHFRRGNTLHVFVRGYRALGYTGSDNNLNVTIEPNEWRGAERIVVHSAGNNIVITRSDLARGDMLSPQEAVALEREITGLLSRYARVLGVRYNSYTNQLQFSTWNYRENEIELLFALNSLAATSRLYSQLIRTSDDPQAVKGAADVYVQQVNIVERAFNRTKSGRANDIRSGWKSLGEDFKRLAEGSSRDFRDAPSYR